MKLTVADLNFDDASSDEGSISASAPLIHITGFQDDVQLGNGDEEELGEDEDDEDEDAPCDRNLSTSDSSVIEALDLEQPTLGLLRRLDQVRTSGVLGVWAMCIHLHWT